MENSHQGLAVFMHLCRHWIAASRFSCTFGAALASLKKVLRPSPPALGHLRNCKQSLYLIAITSVDTKYILNSEIMTGPLDDSDLVSSPHITLDD